MYRILIIEDDEKISKLLANYLDKYNYKPIILEHFNHVTEEFIRISPHLVLLDIQLPKFDGFYWCKKIRKMSSCPIIFISARVSAMDQVMAIEYGADDYITKPFYYEVVMAKIKSQIRRCYEELSLNGENEREIHFFGLTLFPERPEFYFREKRVTLPKKEAELLELFLRNYPRMVKRDKIFEVLWDESNFISENTLNVNIARLRKRLLEAGITNAIETIKGRGYRISVSWKEK